MRQCGCVLWKELSRVLQSVARLHHRHQRYLQPSSRRSCCKPFTRTSRTEAAMASHVCEVRFMLLWHAGSLGVTHAVHRASQHGGIGTCSQGTRPHPPGRNPQVWCRIRGTRPGACAPATAAAPAPHERCRHAPCRRRRWRSWPMPVMGANATRRSCSSWGTSWCCVVTRQTL